jgi:hypothetical protein
MSFGVERYPRRFLQSLTTLATSNCLVHMTIEADQGVRVSVAVVPSVLFAPTARLRRVLQSNP